MDIVNFISAVAGLAEITFSIFTSLHGYYGDLKDGPRQSARLRDELNTMFTLLTNLHETLTENPHSIGQMERLTLEKAMTQFDEMLRDMESRVSVDKTKGFQRLKWPFNQNENKEYIERIERYKSTFVLTMNLENR